MNTNHRLFDVVTLTGGVETMITHHPGLCAGRSCSIHNPSNHHMRNWRQHWRGDRQLMERLCPEHGVGHPDPDDVAHHMRTSHDDDGWYSVHGCCGCCRD